MKRKQTTKADITAAWMEALIERTDGQVSNRQLVTAAEDVSSPMHDRFEWDNEVGGDLHRLAQASQILRQWRGTIMRVSEDRQTITITTARRVQSPQSERGKGLSSYSTVEKIMADPVRRHDLIRTVLSEMAAYRKRYADIVALAEVWRAIDDAIDLHGDRSSRSDDLDADSAVA